MNTFKTIIGLVAIGSFVWWYAVATIKAHRRQY